MVRPNLALSLAVAKRRLAIATAGSCPRKLGVPPGALWAGAGLTWPSTSNLIEPHHYRDSKVLWEISSTDHHIHYIPHIYANECSGNYTCSTRAKVKVQTLTATSLPTPPPPPPSELADKSCQSLGEMYATA